MSALPPKADISSAIYRPHRPYPPNMTGTEIGWQELADAMDAADAMDDVDARMLEHAAVLRGFMAEGATG